MTEAHAPAVPAIVLRRRYKASRERVFAAWTTPEIAARFLGPSDISVPEIEMDVRPGGSYRIAMMQPDGERFIVGGVYHEVRPPERLVMTWRWQEDDPAAEYDSLLTLEFNEHDGETEVILTHQQLATVASRDRLEHGWTLILDQLAKAL
ncbi:MAG: SRPBCC family protein [Vulcanimicrobiaceae bacterium]